MFDSSIRRALVVAVRSGSRNVRSKSVNRLHHWRRVAVALSSALVFAAMSVTPTAGADTSQCTKFYTPPEPLPAGTDGDVIRSESTRLVLEPSGQLGGSVADGTPIRYRSTDDHGEPIAVTATYLKPHNPWSGQEARPLIVFGPNSYGIGDQCATSKMFNQGVHWGGGADLTMGNADPEIRDGLLSSVTEAEKNLFNQSADECFDDNVMRFGFRHVQQYFVSPMEEAIANEPLRSICDAQRIGRLRPAAPVFVDSKRYDSFIPWDGARGLALDWCAQGADVQVRTNDQPAFMNKTATNNLSTNFVDGERAMQWVADGSNGMSTASNCAEMR